MVQQCHTHITPKHHGNFVSTTKHKKHVMPCHITEYVGTNIVSPTPTAHVFHNFHSPSPSSPAQPPLTLVPPCHLALHSQFGRDDQEPKRNRNRNEKYQGEEGKQKQPKMGSLWSLLLLLLVLRTISERHDHQARQVPCHIIPYHATLRPLLLVSYHLDHIRITER